MSAAVQRVVAASRAAALIADRLFLLDDVGRVEAAELRAAGISEARIRKLYPLRDADYLPGIARAIKRTDDRWLTQRLMRNNAYTLFLSVPKGAYERVAGTPLPTFDFEFDPPKADSLRLLVLAIHATAAFDFETQPVELPVVILGEKDAWEIYAFEMESKFRLLRDLEVHASLPRQWRALDPGALPPCKKLSPARRGLRLRRGAGAGRSRR